MKIIEIDGRKLEVHENGDIFRCSFISKCGRKLQRKKLIGGMFKARIGYNRINFRGKTRHVLISTHRVVAMAYLPDWNPALTVDHIDGNSLNNAASNLRMVTQLENMRGHYAPSGVSKYRGVAFSKKEKQWQAQIRNKGKRVWLGYHNTEEGAALAFNRAAVKLGFFPEALNKIDKSA